MYISYICVVWNYFGKHSDEMQIVNLRREIFRREENEIRELRNHWDYYLVEDCVKRSIKQKVCVGCSSKSGFYFVCQRFSKIVSQISSLLSTRFLMCVGNKLSSVLYLQTCINRFTVFFKLYFCYLKIITRSAFKK